ncbi:MAG: heparan-alpha-glucosaminide N-acetyltransferase domain-containing protein [Candidatus Kapabacteria bacterium]|jgi:uncharacterized membrane protein|nr:heparan-alpha-glucosaminide N-acetyltransferase domain-containing protein [Candidatus Kapabacteria bacterium]
MLQKYFSSDLTNESGRITAFDLMRLIAILMMIQGHTIYALGDPAEFDISTFPWNIWHSLRGLTAPVFLVISGIVSVFANRRDESGRIPKQIIYKRLRVAGLIMFIGYWMMFPASTLIDMFFIEQSIIDRFLQVKILRVIAITLFALTGLFALTRSYKSMGITSLIIGIAIIAVSPWAMKYDWFAVLPEGIAAFLSEKHGSEFTIFPYSAYMFIGAAIGSFLRHLKTERITEFIKIFALPFGSVLIFSAWLVESHYYIIGESLLKTGGVLIEMWIVCFIYDHTKGLSKYYSLFGRYSLFLYVLHLQFLYGSWLWETPSIAFGSTLPMLITIGAAILNIILCLSIAYGADKYVMNNPKFKLRMKYAFAGIVIFSLMF